MNRTENNQRIISEFGDFAFYRSARVEYHIQTVKHMQWQRYKSR